MQPEREQNIHDGVKKDTWDNKMRWTEGRKEGMIEIIHLFPPTMNYERVRVKIDKKDSWQEYLQNAIKAKIATVKALDMTSVAVEEEEEGWGRR